MKLRFHLPAFIVFLILLLVEIFIALYVHDRIIRPYGGDLLVVVLIYYFIRSFIDSKPVPTVIAVFLFACAVEMAQYFNLVAHLGLQKSRFWNIVIGNSFHWLDILSYALGAIAILIITLVGSAKNRQPGSPDTLYP
ncbi:ribosomal maturation YjgA family protein [Taibaiella koreensis]|uniref:ribosomal maturation YjgA family protein n=1 Tax=Taibaiella koreensis TaxID=1268548 RepID=UPI000E59FB36|nr:DUF2809 domain-containing protein [Taibaiella koreensis]